ncbi:MAG: helix-turn-helix transcriptional regulator [Prevotellaceae bacterium]|nr:helix-turn-helix transcriptional regulator [Prevotellaceae bacterium]
MKVSPRIAIIDANTLATIGLKSILQEIMPIMQVDIYGSFAELQANNPEKYFHYFVAMNIVLEHRTFFLEKRNKTIVLTLGLDNATTLSDFHSLCVNVPEKQLVKSLLALEQHAHANGRNLPPVQRQQPNPLSDREIEVLSLVAQGHINKEIADILNISMPTVVSHRKNITEKLGMKSISALTIYAVMHGYVDINKI